MSKRLNVQTSQCPNVSMSKRLNVQMSQCPNVSMSKRLNVQMSPTVLLEIHHTNH